MFQTESQSGTDPDLKKFATDTLPTIQSHLDQATALAGTGHKGMRITATTRPLVTVRTTTEVCAAHAPCMGGVPAGWRVAGPPEEMRMFIAMNRFRVALGSEADFEQVWLNRDVHLRHGARASRTSTCCAGRRTRTTCCMPRTRCGRPRRRSRTWTRSEAFRDAHRNAGQAGTRALYHRSAAVRGLRGAADGGARIDGDPHRPRSSPAAATAGRPRLGDGTRILKSSVRVEAYGSVDEANAAVGVLRLPGPGCCGREMLAAHPARAVRHRWRPVHPGRHRTRASAWATTGCSVPLDAEISPSVRHCRRPLDSFVLPGGSAGAAHAHVVRTVVRRAERRVVALAAAETSTPWCCAP